MLGGEPIDPAVPDHLETFPNVTAAGRRPRAVEPVALLRASGRVPERDLDRRLRCRRAAMHAAPQILAIGEAITVLELVERAVEAELQGIEQRRLPAAVQAS